ncbi:uncharacterized protein RSE6_04892 [Rhynchosporium secalis]|uniref:Inner kinetochore subunit AME1 domain-containing protein n=1 Tax=Rhynchosporium secalis TaxID=38038 RepID=A0A1E1M6I4_RHYSE|nr:uncharacterized protein RSE6_04892 [Rhynchosporium secalis]
MTSREDRIQSRLRGAQRREIKDVEFGLTFTIPPADPSTLVEVSPDTLPPFELPPQRSSRRTPARPLPSVAAISQDVSRVSQSTNDANTSAKRKKLNTDISQSSRSTRSQDQLRPDAYEVPAEPDGEEEEDSSIIQPAAASVVSIPNIQNEGQGPPEASLLTESDVSFELESTSVVQPGTASSPARPARTPSALQTFDEVTESPKNAPGSGRRQRVAIESTLQSSSQLHEVQTMASDTTPVTQRKRKREVSTLRGPSRIRQTQSSTVLDELDELSPEQPIRPGRKPKIVKDTSPDVDVTAQNVDEEEAEAIDDEEAASILKKNRGRRTSKRFAAASPDLDILIASSTVKRPSKRPIESPVKQRHPKNAASRPQVPKKIVKKAAKNSAKQQRVSISGPIPVTVHRLTLPPLYDERETDADILDAEMPHMKRSGVNAIDVLKQLCEEVISNQLRSLEQMGNSCEDTASRREYKTKWNAVEAFGSDLQLRLLTQTVNLDNAYCLKHRVKDELRRKIILREELLQIRKEREQLALRMDEIRMKHEKEKTDAQSRDFLNTAVHDIEMAIEMGKSKQDSEELDRAPDMIGTELLISRVAAEVSNKGDSGGILRQIKQFNAFLERTALALETRKV